MSGDYSLITTRIQHFFLAPPDELEVTYRPDGVIEDDEVFELRLESDSGIPLPTGPGVFYRQTLMCTIVDGDGKVRKKLCQPR